MSKEERVLCYICNKPILEKEFGGISKAGYFHNSCYIKSIRFYEKIYYKKENKNEQIQDTKSREKSKAGTT